MREPAFQAAPEDETRPDPCRCGGAERRPSLVENARELIYTLDADRRLTSVNRAAERITGYSRDELVGRRCDWLFPCGGDRQVTFDATITTKDGSERILEVSALPLVEDGEVVGVQGVARDVTERRAAASGLLRTQTMEAVGRLAGGVAQEFNDLLTAIGGYAELILSRLPPTDPVAQDAKEIRKAGARAASLTQQLLALSRGQVLAPKVLDLNALVGDCAPILRRLLGDEIALEINARRDLWHVRVDPDQLAQALASIAANARGAMPVGGRVSIETANVEIDAARAARLGSMAPGRYVVLAVSDTGIGMHAEVRSHAFEPFYTTKPWSPGAGLGLATVYGIVKQSDGFVWVSSEPGRGARFEIYLPRVEAELDGSPESPGVAGGESVLPVAD
jgi:two-component system, cell cycle sensor histidine kinase and response regulator CckA